MTLSKDSLVTKLLALQLGGLFADSGADAEIAQATASED